MLQVCCARGLSAADSNGLSDPYVIVQLGQRSEQARVLHPSRKPAVLSLSACVTTTLGTLSEPESTQPRLSPMMHDRQQHCLVRLAEKRCACGRMSRQFVGNAFLQIDGARLWDTHARIWRLALH